MLGTPNKTPPFPGGVSFDLQVMNQLLAWESILIP
jgi:hypothetical protein